MIRRADYTWADAGGTPEPGVWITVKTATGALATLFNDDGSSLSNPFQSGTLGAFVYNVATEGVYTEEYRLSLSDSPRKVLGINLALSGPGGLFFTPQMFGATGTGATVADPTPDATAFVAAIAALKAYALNSGGGAYKGSPKLFIPAGHYYLGTTTLDINHSLMIEGEGAEKAPHPAYGPTHLRWADGVCGIRTQFPTTSGTTTVGAGHDGAGAVYLRNFSMEGGYTSTNTADSHAIVVRTITYLDNILIRNWSGTGVLTWTTNVNGVSPPGFSGNASVSRYTGVKVEGCKIAFDTRGTDSNIITFIGCEAYQCRQAGFVDDNGAGSNTYIGTHAASNGAVGGVGIYTQVSYSGKIYAVRWGQETWCAANAPSGTSDDNTGWIYVGTGGVDSLHPAWTNGMSGLAAGGDYIMLSNYPTIPINCYSEGGGGLSQLGNGTLALGGTNLGITSAGGTCLVPEYDGLALKRYHSQAVLHLDGAGNSAGGFDVREAGTNWVGGGYFSNQRGIHYAAAANGHEFHTIAANVATYRGSWTQYGIAIPAGSVFYVNSLQVLSARKTGWAVDTGTAKRTANATYSGTAEVGYTQATVQTLMDAVRDISQTVKALKDDLHSTAGHGMIGT